MWPILSRGTCPLVEVNFGSGKGCSSTVKISNLERRNLITKETNLSRKVLLRLRIWGRQGRWTSISKGPKPAWKQQCKPEKMLTGLVWLKHRTDNHLAVTTTSQRPDVGALRFILKNLINHGRRLAWRRALWRRGALLGPHHSGSSSYMWDDLTWVVFKLDGNEDSTCKSSLLRYWSMPCWLVHCIT